MSFDVTVITPVFNNQLFIERTINSVLSQKEVKVEYIIIDGKSTDNTESIIKKYIEKIDIYISERDNGLYDAINKGIKLSKSDRIVVLNSGDYYSSEYSLKSLVKCSISQDNQNIIYGKMLVQNEDCTEPDLIEIVKQNKIFMLKGCDIPHPTTLIPKSIYNKFGLYSTHFKIMSDYDLLLRMHRNGVIFKGLDETIIIFQRGGISAKFYKCLPESYSVRKRNGINLLINLFFTFRSFLYYLINFLFNSFGLKKTLNYLIMFRRKFKL